MNQGTEPDVHPFVFMLKSYSHDFLYAKRLVESFLAHNKDDIRLYLVIPKEDGDLFERLTGKNIVIIYEETIPVLYAKALVNGVDPGYINQQIVKLSFWRLELCQNYLCLDSDAVFIRDFYLKDFMVDGSRAYTVMAEDRELQIDFDFYEAYFRPQMESIKRIRDFLNINTEVVLLTCWGAQIISCELLERMYLEFLLPNSLEYLDLLTISPHEFTWYTYYLQKCGVSYFPREPYFKTYHTRQMLARDKLASVTIDDIKRGYLGIILQSSLTYKSVHPMEFTLKIHNLLSQSVPIQSLFLAFLLSLKRLPSSLLARIQRTLRKAKFQR